MTIAEVVRPRSLDEMIGQEAIKRKLRIAIGAALHRDEPLGHVLLVSSGGGLGKSSLAQVIANEMFVPFVTTTGQCLWSAADLKRVLFSLKPKSVLLIDEFHLVGRHAAEELLLVLEEGVLHVNADPRRGPVRLELPPFTLAAATTVPEAVKGPLAQRFSLHLHLGFYTAQELEQIVRQMTSRMGFEFEDGLCAGLARRAKGIPRLALRLAERVRDVGQAKRLSSAGADEFDLAMQIEGIDDLGLNRQDRDYMRVLAQAEPRPTGVHNLGLSLGMGTRTITDVLEGPLVRLGMISIGIGGRRLTDEGKRHLETVGDKFD